MPHRSQSCRAHLRGLACSLSLVLALLLTGCTAPRVPDNAAAAPVAESAAIADNEAELDALTGRIAGLEARIVLLEQALHTAQLAPTIQPADQPPATTQPAATPAADIPVSAATPPALPTDTPSAVALIPTATASASLPAPSAPAPDSAIVNAPVEVTVNAPVAWDQARNYIGQTATVCGPVVATQFAQQSNGQPTFLNVGLAFPAAERFQVVIWGNRRAQFPTPPEIAYRDTSICVTGEIGEYRGTAEVTVLGPEAIQPAP